jgi:hydrogenase expression/formation protein HypE
VTTVTSARIALKHGAGGRAMRRLIEDVLVDRDCAIAAAMDDGAAIPIGDRWLIFTTDAHVIQPIVFPGGDIGRLAICGTVNDLAMMGATVPLGLSCAVIAEEGFEVEALREIRQSMTIACREAGAPIVTGDTKVMGRGEVDRLVITTAGVGIANRVVRDSGLRPGDVIIVTGTVGDHGIAVMAARHQLEFGGSLRSDVAPLNGLVRAALDAGGDAVVAMKDPTRGGVAGALHEFAAKSRVGILLNEPAVPVREQVRAAAELLGIDPLLIANEGKALIGVREPAAGAVLRAIREHPLGRDAAVVAVCSAEFEGSVVVDTGFGRRVLPEADGELLPRIC